MPILPVPATDTAAIAHVQFMAGCDGHNVATRVEGDGRNWPRELEGLNALTGERVPEPHFAVE